MRTRSATTGAFVLSAGALLALTSACGDDGGRTAPQRYFGVSSNPGSSAEAASPIHGTSMAHYITETGEKTAPVDLMGYAIKAWVRDEAGSFTEFSGEGRTDGTFNVSAEVPSGAYYLGLQPPSAGVTLSVDTSHTPAFDAYKLGRPDVVLSASGTTLVFDVTGLHPWKDDDDLVLFSPNAGAIVYSPHLNASVGAPKAGDTALTGMSVDYAATYTGTALPPALIEGTKGDVAYLDQLVHGTMPGASYFVLGAFCSPAAFTQANGMGASFACALEDVAPTQTFGIKMKRAIFERQIVNVHPSATFFESEVVLRAMPKANAYGLYSGSPELVVFEPGPDDADLDVKMAYGNPFPAAWDLYATYISAFNVSVLAPGASTPRDLHLRVRNDVPLSTVSDAPTVPIVTPPKGLRVNSADGFKAQTDVTTTPTISWEPPDIGSPDRYEVIVHRIDNKKGKTAEQVVSRIKTRDTQVTFPPGALVAEQTYVIEVLASKGQGLPFGSASTVSSLLTP